LKILHLISFHRTIRISVTRALIFLFVGSLCEVASLSFVCNITF